VSDGAFWPTTVVRLWLSVCARLSSGQGAGLASRWSILSRRRDW